MPSRQPVGCVVALQEAESAGSGSGRDSARAAHRVTQTFRRKPYQFCSSQRMEEDGCVMVSPRLSSSVLQPGWEGRSVPHSGGHSRFLVEIARRGWRTTGWANVCRWVRGVQFKLLMETIVDSNGCNIRQIS